MRDWAPQVLTALAECAVPATFFLRRDHVTAHADLRAPPVGRHEYANHTWDHTDLARLVYDGCTDQLVRAGDAIAQHLGARPTLMRPPHGHIAGSTLLACDDLGLTPVLWNLQMIESSFTADRTGWSGTSRRTRARGRSSWRATRGRGTGWCASTT
ncbi:polysaccharide deacetylase family protein [Cellulomonas hominis]